MGGPEVGMSHMSIMGDDIIGLRCHSHYQPLPTTCVTSHPPTIYLLPQLVALHLPSITTAISAAACHQSTDRRHYLPSFAIISCHHRSPLLPTLATIHSTSRSPPCLLGLLANCQPLCLFRMAYSYCPHELGLIYT